MLIFMKIAEEVLLITETLILNSRRYHNLESPFKAMNIREDSALRKSN